MSTLRGKAAVVGIGQTPYYKRGTSPDPEPKLALRAIVAACEDAGIDPRDVDGFVSYGSEHNTGQMLAPALGTREIRFAGMPWTHGGGIPGAVGMAAMAIVTGQANIVVVYRAMAEGNAGRLQVAVKQGNKPPQFIVNGIDMVLIRKAMRFQRMAEVEGVPEAALFAMVKASYHHALNNPGAASKGLVMDEETYYDSRFISEPFRLFDCSRENDGAAAVIVVSAERAKDLQQKPAYLLSAPVGSDGSYGVRDDNHEPYTSVGMTSLARRLWAESGYSPADIDVAQVYENYSGMGIAALIDFGFCTRETARDFFTFENLIAPNGGLPINTSGGSLAEGFIHGMGLVPEAVRQIRGTSVNQVPAAALSLMTGGPGDAVTSAGLFGSEETL